MKKKEVEKVLKDYLLHWDYEVEEADREILAYFDELSKNYFD